MGYQILIKLARSRLIFKDGLPIHYPRLNQDIDSEGKNYEWFEKNEKGQQVS